MYSNEFLSIGDAITGDRNYIKVDLNMVRRLGLETAVVYRVLYTAMKSFLMSGNLGKDGFFYYTVDDLEFFSGVKRRGQETSIEDLVRLELIQKETRIAEFAQRKRYFRLIDNPALLYEMSSPVTKEEFRKPKQSACQVEITDSKSEITDCQAYTPLIKNKTKKEDIINDNEVLGKPSNVQTTLVEVKGKPSFSNQYVNHKAVIMYRQKKGILEHYTKTDWLMEFVLAYNVVFNSYYPLPPYGSQFNSLVAPFTDLVAEVKPAQRVTVFKLFNELVQRGSGLPDSFQAGYALEQLVSGWNLSKAKELMKHCANLLDFSEAKPTSSKSNQLF